MNRLLILLPAILLFACGGAADPGGGDGDADAGQTTNPPATRTVRELCRLEVARLEACQAIDAQTAAETAAACASSQYTDGQIAYFVGCVRQWGCGGSAPACLNQPVTPECNGDAQCRAGETCDADGLCQCFDTDRLDIDGRRCIDPQAPVVHQGDLCPQDGYTCGNDGFYCYASSLAPGQPGRCLQSCAATGACPGSLKCCHNAVRDIFVCDVDC